MNYGQLGTEQFNELSQDLDCMSTCEITQLMNRLDLSVIEAVKQALPEIAKTAEEAAERIKKGGRVFYLGAGTSGRLGVLDASECPPTFGVSKDTVIGIIAGGDKTLRSASEGEEDSGDSGIRDISALNITELDSVVGISAAGNAAYVYEAMKYASGKNALVIAITCNENTLITKVADISIIPDTGAEVVTGSTRLKAGTAQKLILNMLSTGVMINTGKVYENLMINVKPVNKKLRERCIGIISELTNADYETCKKALDNNEGNIRKAVEYIKGERI